jgi:hypothetical protein
VVDDTALTSAGFDWTGTYPKASVNQGGLSYATRRGARADGPLVHARQVAVLTVTCATCGTLAVYIGATKVGTIDTYSARTHYRVWRVVSWSSTIRVGQLGLVVTSSGKRVFVDGFGVRLH